MKSSYVERAKVFIEAIYPYIEDSMQYTLRVQNAIRLFNTTCHRRVVMSSGMSRIALITSDYVIKWDYTQNTFYGTCETEYQLYNEHKDDDLSYLLAPVVCYTTHGKNFYIMPRVFKIAERIDDDLEIEEYLDDDERNYLFHDLALKDIHSGNWGFNRGSETPMIFDYAWYDDKDDEESNEGTWSW